MNSDLNILEERIGYTFQNRSLLRQSMTHSSYVNEHRMMKNACNERLEFLGDAVLEMCSSDFLFRNYANKQEGDLTRLRASIVCEPTLAYCAADLELGSFLLLGKGEEASGGRERNSVVSDAMEALIGAIYLDGGFANAKEFIDRFIMNDFEHKQLFYDSKTTLQEIVQEKPDSHLEYELIRESGPDHNKTFETRALLNGEEIGRGSGRTKKAAEAMAAYKGILKLRENECI